MTNPYYYGHADYDLPRSREKKKHEKLAPGALVSWRTRDGRYECGIVVQDWGQYGVQVEVQDEKGQPLRRRLSEGEAEKISLLDALARAAM